MDIRYILSLLILFSLAGMAAALPVLPDEFGGSVTLDGQPAPAGTVITAKIDWNERGSTTTTQTGEYGPLDSPGVLIVKATEDDLRRSGSPVITFWVNGHKADQEIAFVGGTVRQLDLSASTGGEKEEIPVASGSNSFDLEGVDIVDTDGKQQIVIDERTFLGGITTNETAIILNDMDGWEEMVIFTQERPTGDRQVTGTIESVHARTSPVTTGTGWAQIDLEMSGHPGSNALLDTTILQNPSADEQEAFETAISYQLTGRSINDVAYVLNVQKNNVDNEEDGGIIRTATIRMVVGSDWVDSMGGPENVKILRRADDGTTTALDTNYVFDPAADLYTFEALSPNGLSVFALVATKDTSSSEDPGGSGNTGGGPGTGPGSGSSKDPGSEVTYDPNAPGSPVVFDRRAPLTTSVAGVVLEPVTVRTDNRVGAVTILEGTIALDSEGNALTEVTCSEVAPAEVPPAPPGTTIAIALRCGPAGATFDPPATLTYTLSTEEWAKIGEGATPKVMWYNTQTGEWQEIAATVDPAARTVTTEVEHFSLYALVWTVPETVVAGAEGTVTPGGEPVGGPGPALPLWALALIIVLVVALAASLLVRRK